MPLSDQDKIIAGNLRFARERAGLTLEEAAERIGVTNPAISQWEVGKTRPRMRNLRVAAEVYGAELSTLLSGERHRVDGLQTQPHGESPGLVQPPLARTSYTRLSPVNPVRQRAGPEAEGLPVTGVVEAGAWRSREEFGDLTEDTVDLVRDPRFPNARQEAHRVRGDSMDQAGIHDGYFVRVIRYEDAPISLRTGTILVVERRMNGGGLVERTLKAVEVINGSAYRLHPRSNNPRHETIEIPQDVDLTDENAEFRVIGFVTAAINPIAY